MSALHIIRHHYLDCASRDIEHAKICLNRAWAQHRHPDCPPLSDYALAAMAKDIERLERMLADAKAIAARKLELVEAA